MSRLIDYVPATKINKRSDPEIFLHGQKLPVDPYTLRHKHGVRFHHFHSAFNDRLVSTLATRERPDGKVEASVSIINPNQGQTKGEEPPSRRAGRRNSLARLCKGIEKQKIFSAAEAKRVLEHKPDYRNDQVVPADIKVVVFEHEHLKQLIRTRQIFDYFPGKKWLPLLKPRRDFVPTKKKKPVGFLTRLANLFK